MVVGHAGADFEWAQDPVELDCDCGEPMQPLFQIDEAWGMTTATYTLACTGCKNAKLVVQSY